MKHGLWVWCLAMVIGLAGCGDEASKGTTAPGGEGAADEGGAAGVAPVGGGDLSTPRGSIEHQVALLKAGDLDKFKVCFTKRQQKRITEEAMAKGAKEVGSMSIDDLFASMTEGEYQGHKTATVKMKNGRTLTTLILTDGRWLADTIWFK